MFVRITCFGGFSLGNCVLRYLLGYLWWVIVDFDFVCCRVIVCLSSVCCLLNCWWVLVGWGCV